MTRKKKTLIVFGSIFSTLFLIFICIVGLIALFLQLYCNFSKKYTANENLPTTTYIEAPFTLVYEIDGKQYTLNDTYVQQYARTYYSFDRGAVEEWNYFLKSSGQPEFLIHTANDEDIYCKLSGDFLNHIHSIAPHLYGEETPYRNPAVENTWIYKDVRIVNFLISPPTVWQTYLNPHTGNQPFLNYYDDEPSTKPCITEGSFDFSITYEVDGEQTTVENQYLCSYAGVVSDTSYNYYNKWDGKIKGSNHSGLLLYKNKNVQLRCFPGVAELYMADPNSQLEENRPVLYLEKKIKHNVLGIPLVTEYQRSFSTKEIQEFCEQNNVSIVDYSLAPAIEDQSFE